MIGYSISIYKFIEDTDITSTKNEEKALVTWTSGGFGGLDWINNLVSKAKAEDLGGNGYPFYYKVQAQFLLEALLRDTSKNKDLQQHYKTQKHLNNINSMELYKCHNCNKCYKYETGLEKHLNECNIKRENNTEDKLIELTNKIKILEN